MRFGEQHRAGDALRLELEEAVADDREARIARRPATQGRATRLPASAIRRVGRATVPLAQQMDSVHGVYPPRAGVCPDTASEPLPHVFRMSALLRTGSTLQAPTTSQQSIPLPRECRAKSNAKLLHNSGASASNIQSPSRHRRRSGARRSQRRLRSSCPIPLPPRHDRTAPARRRRARQRHPRARDGRRRGGEVRSSRHADGHGRDRRRAVDASPAPQPRQSALARSRSLRAVERPRLDAAVRAAAPDRLRPADRRAAALPPARTRRRRAIPKSASRPASRRRPARSARASPTRVGMALAEKLLARDIQPARATRSSITTRTCSSATAA